MSFFVRHLIIGFILSLMVCSSLAAQSNTTVSVQLDWVYQFQYAGFIAAKEKGFYNEVGLNAELNEYTPGLDTIGKVLSGQYNYGINNSSIVVHEGKIVPLVLLATYLQNSPLVFITSPEIKKPIDFIGKRLMGTTDELKYSSLALLLDHFSINKQNTQITEHTFNIKDFIEKRVEVMSIFRSNQLYELDKLGAEYNIIDPADYGFYMSAVNVFCSKDEALHFPERTQKFINATNRGWQYALDNTEEIIDLIYDKYSQKKSKDALRYEARIIREMMLLDFYPIGQANEELSRRALKQLQQANTLPADDSLGTFLFHDLIREYNQQLTWSAKEQKYLKEKGEITICVDPDWMPIEAIINGQHVGIAADIFDVFEKLLPIPISLIKANTWSESLEKVATRQCDILSLAIDTPERRAYLDFTESFIDLPIVMATQEDTIFIEDISQLANKKVGIVKNYAHADLIRKKNPHLTIVEVNSIEDGLRRVEQGEIFGYIDNLLVVAAQIQHEFAGSLKISARLDEKTPLAIGTRNDEPILHDIFQTLVGQIRKDQLQATFNKWTPVSYEVGFNYPLLIKTFFVLLIVAIAFLFHYLRLRQYSKQLKILSITDKLTGLYNRMKMEEVLSYQYQQLARYNSECGLIMLDIDHFKRINDHHGHQTGDKVLIEFSSLLRENIRTTDIAGRWGGEEFIILCPHIGEDGVRNVSEKLLTQIRSYPFLEGEAITASLGVSMLNADLSIAQNVDHIDNLMYQSKKLGRNRMQFSK